MRQIPGVPSILNQSANVGWQSEPTVDPAIVQLFEVAWRAIKLLHFDEAAEALSQLARYPLQPSQQMRLHYAQGEIFFEMKDYLQACRFYEMALDLAMEANDLDSQILLSMLAGMMMYGSLRNHEAIAYYRQALDIWHVRTKRDRQPSIDPEMMILTYLGQPLWMAGDFDEAQASLARSLTLATYRRGFIDIEQLRGMTALSLWALALVLRSQSDTQDGDASLINTAIRRAHKALGLYESIGTTAHNMARFYIQIAELYLDLAELHLERGAIPAARSMRSEALNHVTVAIDYLQPDEDEAAKLLARLTLARHSITWRLDRAAARRLGKYEETFTQIEHNAAAIDDRFVSAKAATLRGEWLLWVGDSENARKALLLALEGFAGDGMGMATRAQRLLRRIEPSPDPGGQRRDSGGPLPEPLTLPTLGDDELN